MLQFARWKTIVAWLVAFASFLIALPTVLPPEQAQLLPSWMSGKRLAPGLDLTGGTYLMLKLEHQDVLNDRLAATVDATAQALRSARIPYSGLMGTGHEAQVRIRDAARTKDALAALASLAGVTTTDDGTGLLHVVLTPVAIEEANANAARESLDVVTRRMRELGLADGVARLDGKQRIVVQVAGLSDPQRLKDMLGQRGTLSARLIDTKSSVEAAMESGAPPGTQLLYSLDEPPEGFLVNRSAVFTAADITAAAASVNDRAGAAAIELQLNPAAAERLSQTTRDNIGQRLAIVLDEQVLSTLDIDAPIAGDALKITGGFDETGAVNLAMVLRAGELPASLTLLEERSIEPALGASSARSALLAVLVSGVAVAIFMAGFYGTFGLIAAIGLCFNLLMILAVLVLTGTVITLPGIAGIVLIIGIAVDSNVLIYERMREEYRNEPSLADAVENGYSRAFSTIVDAAMTTLIAVLVLFLLGSAPIQGFAIVVGVGIITTFFVTFTLTRWLIVGRLRLIRASHLPRAIRTVIFDGVHLRFMSIRNRVFLVTALLTIGAAGLMMSGAVHMGIDFSGGALLEVRARQGDADAEDIAGRLRELNLGDVFVRGSGSPSTAVIRIYTQEGGENAEQTSALVARGELEEDYEIRRVEVVGPSVSGDFISAATFGILVGFLALMGYIWARFEWQFAIGAIIAVAHDIFLTIGFLALLSLEFNIGSVAALLTIAGYSLNDTVVVYDRIRENLKRYRLMPLPLVIDASINQTLSRTVLTSATTLLALAMLAIFGGEAIRAFTLTMLFGVAVGTFSSIYIAGPVLILFKLRPDRYRIGRGGTSAAPQAGGDHA
ncbi:protein translocase subunit SecD [Sinorhizobium sp. BG8]|uniref:protein translocase subunit SecD n=1 Tax=Sinorhizobium sp. BG8 TaxID=2613773 RepID=UPI00193D7569|nr:protein translocase subunit SecD [Sinorhizobium sp. BG8]QRM55375.1 protein translocase subunit SecD [Sinorhizobium sp. BG8]